MLSAVKRLAKACRRRLTLLVVTIILAIVAVNFYYMFASL